MARPKPTSGRTPRETVADDGLHAADKRLAVAALRKQADGLKPNRQELAALRRVEKARERAGRHTHYHNCPLADYRAMSGRQTKVLQEQAERHGIPCAGPVIDLAAVIRRFHDLLAEHRDALAAAKQDVGAGVPGSESRAEAMRRREIARAGREELRLERERGRLIPRDEHEASRRALVLWVDGVFERAASELAASLGPKAQPVVAHYFEELRSHIAGDDHDGPNEQDENGAR